MASKSVAQQRLMGIAYSVKTGESDLDDLNKELRDKIKPLLKMSTDDLKKYASTSHDGLPYKAEGLELAGIGIFKGDVFRHKQGVISVTETDDDHVYFEVGGNSHKESYTDFMENVGLGSGAVQPGSTVGMGIVSLPKVGGVDVGSGDVPTSVPKGKEKRGDQDGEENDEEVQLYKQRAQRAIAFLNGVSKLQ